MFLCPTCGNKRCPKATDHHLNCTGRTNRDKPGACTNEQTVAETMGDRPTEEKSRRSSLHAIWPARVSTCRHLFRDAGSGIPQHPCLLGQWPQAPVCQQHGLLGDVHAQSGARGRGREGGRQTHPAPAWPSLSRVHCRGLGGVRHALRHRPRQGRGRLAAKKPRAASFASPSPIFARRLEAMDIKPKGTTKDALIEQLLEVDPQAFIWERMLSAIWPATMRARP